VKFNSKSIIMEQGIQVKTDVYIPGFLMDYEIPDEVWSEAIVEFNKKLNVRTSVTQKINGIDADVLQIAPIEDTIDDLRMGAVVLLLVVRGVDVEKIADIHFCLTGQLIFKLGTTTEVEQMIIKNITYGGEDSKKFRILEENS
jgi:hypothetical protein